MTLKVVISDGEGWDHVSVSLPDRCPTWEEMEYVKRLFFDPREAAFQFHPPLENYVNFHEFCLHIWKPQWVGISIPNASMVGPSGGRR